MPLIAPALLVVAAATASLLGSGTPSAWHDEAATVTMIRRPMGSLLVTVLTDVDAVHATYYVGLKLWAAALGSDVAVLRAASAVGVAVASGLVWALARELGLRRGALVAGAVFAACPFVTWAGSEARPYGWIAAAGAASGLCFVRARAGSRARWIIYGVVATVGCYLSIYIVLEVVALLAGAAFRRGERGRMRGPVMTSIVVIALTLPLVGISARQQAQVSWIPRPGISTILQLPWQWSFAGSWYPLIAVPLLAGGVMLLARGRRGSRALTDARAVLLAWLILPTTLLLVVSVLGKPLYVPRYTAMSLPVFAIVATLALIRLRRVGVLAGLLLVITALPTYLVQRGPQGKGDDWRTAVAAVERLRAPSTGIYFVPRAGNLDPREMLYVYPASFRGFEDVALRTSGATSAKLWDELYPLGASVGRTSALRGVVVVQTSDQVSSPVVTAFERAGLRLRMVRHVPGIDVLGLHRGP